MSGGKMSYPYDYENVLLIDSELSPVDEEIEEKRCVYDPDDINGHDKTNDDARKKLISAAILSVVFMVIELTGGYLAGSLAIMSDAAHLITDSLTFVVGAFGITWARKGADPKMTFGYKRVEVFCAIISIIGIWILTLFILYFAVQRLHNLDSFDIDTNTMLVVSILGVLVNIVMAAVLHGGSGHIFQHNHSHGNNLLIHQKSISSGDDEKKILQIDGTQSECKSENINVQAAFLHVLGDFIQSVGVIIAAVIIKFYPQAKIVDPLITFLFSIIVVCTTVKIFKKSAKILLEAAPCQISHENLSSDLKNIDGVESIHELKLWSISNDFHVMTSHIVIKSSKLYEVVLEEATRVAKRHGVSKTTIQLEVR